MLNKRLLTAGIVLFAALCVAVIFVSMQYSRSIDIGQISHIPVATSTTPVATSTASATTTGVFPTQPANFAVVTSSTFIFPSAPIDPTSYDAKMVAIANLPPPRITKTVVATTTMQANGTMKTTTTTVTKTVPVVTGWPVTTAPYPNTGALLPFSRIVAYYGNLYSTQMGILGQYPSAQVLAMLASTTAMWQAADPSTPVIPALDYIAVTAQGTAGADGKYRLRMPPSQINAVLNMANEINGIVYLDIQVGLSNVQTEVPLLEPYLKLPQVELSLDPEFAMHNDARPGTVIGTMDASDINWAANYLASLVQQYNLPPKQLVIHRFTQAMVTHTSEITPLPQVQIVIDMDGFGSPSKKMTTYLDEIEDQPVQFTGFKLFYKNDSSPTIGGHLMTPAEVLKLTPRPSYIQYQ